MRMFIRGTWVTRLGRGERATRPRPTYLIYPCESSCLTETCRLKRWQTQGGWGERMGCDSYEQNGKHKTHNLHKMYVPLTSGCYSMVTLIPYLISLVICKSKRRTKIAIPCQAILFAGSDLRERNFCMLWSWTTLSHSLSIWGLIEWGHAMKVVWRPQPIN